MFLCPRGWCHLGMRTFCATLCWEYDIDHKGLFLFISKISKYMYFISNWRYIISRISRILLLVTVSFGAPKFLLFRYLELYITFCYKLVRDIQINTENETWGPSHRWYHWIAVRTGPSFVLLSVLILATRSNMQISGKFWTMTQVRWNIPHWHTDNITFLHIFYSVHTIMFPYFRNRWW